MTTEGTHSLLKMSAIASVAAFLLLGGTSHAEKAGDKKTEQEQSSAEANKDASDSDCPSGHELNPETNDCEDVSSHASHGGSEPYPVVSPTEGRERTVRLKAGEAPGAGGDRPPVRGAPGPRDKVDPLSGTGPVKVEGAKVSEQGGPSLSRSGPGDNDGEPNEGGTTVISDDQDVHEEDCPDNHADC